MSEVTTLNFPNKFRPNSFADVIGQEHVTNVLQAHIDSGNIPPLTILYGPPGTGKTTIARIFAKLLNPSEHGLIELDSAEEGGKDKIQAIKSSVHNAPMVGKYKTYVFDESHNITRQGFDSLLKITEEPPPHVKFIFLTTDFDKIPGSIASRAEIHSLVRIGNAEIKQRLAEVCKAESKTISNDVLNLVVQGCGGSLRNALISLEQVITVDSTEGDTVETFLGVISAKKLTKFILAYVFKDFKQLFEAIEILKSEKTETSKVVFDLEQLIMDARLFLINNEIINIAKSDLKYFASYVEKKDVDLKQIGESLDKLYDLTIQFESDLKRTANKDALVSRFLVKMAQSFK